jgi:hypothetical protein
MFGRPPTDPFFETSGKSKRIFIAYGMGDFAPLPEWGDDVSDEDERFMRWAIRAMG